MSSDTPPQDRREAVRKLAEKLELDVATGLDGKLIFSYLEGQGDQEWPVEVPQWLIENVSVLINAECLAVLDRVKAKAATVQIQVDFNDRDLIEAVPVSAIESIRAELAGGRETQ